MPDGKYLRHIANTHLYPIPLEISYFGILIEQWVAKDASAMLQFTRYNSKECCLAVGILSNYCGHLTEMEIEVNVLKLELRTHKLAS